MSRRKIHVRELSTLRMGCGGKGKPAHIVDNGFLKEYVGIGWITLREATDDDRRKYPEVSR